MANPFIEKAKRQTPGFPARKTDPPNKSLSETRRIQCHKLAWGHYRDLMGLLQRYTDKDNPEARERVRARVEEARRVADHYA